MRTYTIVRSYKVYEGTDISGCPIEELGGEQLRTWLKGCGYPYEKLEQIIKQVDDQGTTRLKVAKKP